MKDIRSLHIQAIEKVKAANYFKEEGNKKEYVSNMFEAFLLEKEAALELTLDFDSEPTRSVLFRSAANLAFNCEKYEDADKMIHLALSGNPFDEIKNELLNLQIQILDSLKYKPALQDHTAYIYSNILRQDSINLKIKPKVDRHPGTIEIPYVIDFLKNLQASYLSFTDVSFKKLASQEEYEAFNKIYKKDTQLLALDFIHSSFGVTLTADTGIQNYKILNSPVITDFKKKLFGEFKKDVLLPDYNNRDYQKEISDKYTGEERKMIFSPIMPSLDLKSPYRISITNKDFSQTIKAIPQISKATKKILSPDISFTTELPEINLVRKIEQKRGNKSNIILTEDLTNATFEITLSNIHFENKKVYLKEPHKVIIVFLDKHFEINDQEFNVQATTDDYNKVILDYHKNFIESYSKLLKDKESLSEPDMSLLDKFEKAAFRDF
jgi:hypothetical protein